ncbi:MAG: LURP-one-related family protein, partial [Chloroflexota bacterium]|nr:LURP-one-related family protein [Chloroflexota bacterium]
MKRRREERKEEKKTFGRKGTATRYQMRQKLVAFGDDFYIKNEAGQKVFKVDGKVLRVRDTLKFKDLHGNTLCQIQERKLRVKDVMVIEDAEGKKVAEAKKALITPLRDRWTVKIRSGPDLDVQGNILDHEYEIKEGRRKIAQVSKKWFRVRDTYGVEIAPDQEDALILAVTVALDNMA